MTSILISLRDQLIESLRAIEGRTEEIFMVLAESLPSLVSEMRESLARSQDSISCMDRTQDGGCGDTVEITHVVSQICKEMERGSDQFRVMSERDSELFGRLQEGISQLQGISNSIGEIRRDSEDMELVSLNAMTVAVKAGQAGRAFSYITEELKRLANRTITLVEEISSQGEELMENFRTLERALNDARDFQDELISGLRVRVTGSLDELEKSILDAVNDLKRLREESAGLTQPVNGMMEAIQLQDLIRQSIDHIILALEAIRPESEFTTDRALLDELAFIRQIPNLASRLIEDVAGQIDHSVATFLNLTEDAEKRLQHLEEEQRQFFSENTDNSSSDAQGRNATLDTRFQHASNTIDRLLADLQRNVQKKETLVARSGAITKEVEKLEMQFRTFTTLVRRFHSIDIAARIEVAKQEALRRMGTSTEQMTTLTKTIQSDVDRSLEATQEFITSTSTVIDGHHTHFEEETRFVRQFAASIHEQRRSLVESREAMIRSVGNFSLFTDGFVRVFTRSKENGKQLAELSSTIRELCTDLSAMQDAIDSRYREELTARGLETWTIENDRLKEIIDRFTIFTHKQQAGDMVGLHIEEGVEAGDVTLF